MTIWTKFWLAWAIIGFVVEMYAIFRGVEGGTLSEQLWFLRDTSTTIFSGLLILLAWSIYHFRYEGVGTGEGVKSFVIAILVWLFFLFFLTPSPPVEDVSEPVPTQDGGGSPPRNL